MDDLKDEIVLLETQLIKNQRFEKELETQISSLSALNVVQQDKDKLLQNEEFSK